MDRDEIIEYEPACAVCVHYLSGGSCVAFPNGIPTDFAEGQRAHLTVLNDQSGDAVLTVRTRLEAELLESQGYVRSADDVPILGE